MTVKAKQKIDDYSSGWQEHVFSSTFKTNGERIVKDADMAEEIDVKKGNTSKY